MTSSFLGTCRRGSVGLIAAAVLCSSAVLGAGTARAQPLPVPVPVPSPVPSPSAGTAPPDEGLAPPTGPLGPDGEPAAVAEPGPAPTAEAVREWTDTALAIVEGEARLTAVRDTAVRLRQDAAAAVASADAGRVRQEVLGDLLSGLAQAQYLNHGMVQLAAFLSSTPEQSLERWRGERLSDDALADRYHDAEEVRRARAQQADLARAAESAGAEEVHRVEADQAGLVQRQERMRADLAGRFGDGVWQPGTYRNSAPADGRTDPVAQRAVAYALSRMGSPYVWGATGPTEFDCSGLTSKAWEAAGVTVPRTSQEQWAQLPRVPSGAPLRPGDLVVYFEEATHVGLYVGDGLVVHAPRPGTVVRLTALQRMPVAGVVRPEPSPPRP
ncbi:C40 family peptidase [Kitasatospora sp. NPDC058201]|uniref:C40 family peptidase n=1 Tax=unclassified Kitasatospora TaxID=2633591 RepID=UPI003660E61B